MLPWKNSKTSPASRTLPSWSYESDQLLWMIRISDDGRILIEERNPEARTASFACVAADDGRVLWSGLRFEEPWWISLAGIYDGVAYFHGYRRPDMPSPLGIHAVDLATGRILWRNADHIFEFAVGTDVFASQSSFEGRRWFILHATDGSLVRDLGNDDTRIRSLRDEINAVDWFADYRYPQAFDATHPDAASVGGLITQLVDIPRVQGQLDLLTTGTCIVAAWHESAELSTNEAPALDQYMLIADRTTGDLLYAEQINTGLPGPSADSFFQHRRSIIHLKDAHILTSHTLPDDLP